MTKRNWPSIPLERVLHKSEQWKDLEPHREYQEVTVRLWGKGVTLRGVRTGAQITGRRLTVRGGQLILSRIIRGQINAWINFSPLKTFGTTQF